MGRAVTLETSHVFDGEGVELHINPRVLPGVLQGALPIGVCQMLVRTLDYRCPRDLTPRVSNPRTHSDAQIRQLMRSFEHFGFTNPVLVDANDCVIAGHGRIEAAKRLGMERVPTICLNDMSEADIRAYVIADNKLAENAGWDERLLALGFQYLSDLEIELDLTLTGFELPEIDVALQSLVLADDTGPDPADDLPEVDTDPAVTQPGDVWHIGPHRLICGDALKPETYKSLLEGELAQMVFADPPYNVPIRGHVSGLGAANHREFAMAVGEMSSEEFQHFLTEAFRHVAAHSVEGAIHFQCMDWRHMSEMLAAGDEAYSELKNLCVWAKTNGGMGSLYRSQHELVFVFKSGTEKHINNVELGKNGRNRTNVWTHAGANSFGDGQSDLDMHPTVKPVALIRDTIMDCSHRNDIILDNFAGSGSTLVAAHQTGRRGFGIELDPTYCDVIVRRMAETCKLEACLADDRTFAEIADIRIRDAARPVQEEELCHG